MKKIKNRITKMDKDIFGSLFRAKRPLPIRKIAEREGISWPTVKKHVEKLHKLGVVDLNKSVRRTNVTLSPKLVAKLRRMGII